MPIYEFKCAKCRKEFEELCFSSNDVKSIKCPKCKGKNIKRKISAFGFNTGRSSSAGSGSKSSCTKSSCGGCHSCH